jgi:hypothetical protein
MDPAVFIDNAVPRVEGHASCSHVMGVPTNFNVNTRVKNKTRQLDARAI